MDRNEEHTSHYVKLVQLPSGKTIEVVHFEDPAAGEAGAPHRCPSCRSDLVYPTDWSEAGRDRWRVTLRCPECEAVREGVLGEPCIDAFEDRLHAGTEALVCDLRRLTGANMAEEGGRFFAAMAVDAILPEDF